MSRHLRRLLVPSLALTFACQATAEMKHRLLFFSKSSGFEHSVISWKDGKPSVAEKVFLELGEKHSWEFEFSKDGSKFSPEYLAGFDAVIFYTTGDLTTTGTDKQPAMTAAGAEALFNYVRNGKGFIGLHCASDTFHSPASGTDENGRYQNNGKDTSPFICMVGGEFISHGAQQPATNKVVDREFPGFKNLGESFTVNEEWYSLKNFNPDMHALTVIQTEGMQGEQYHRPPYPTAWARTEGKGRVYYNAMGHRDDVWSSSAFQEMLVGAIQWTTGDLDAATPPNLTKVAPEANTNPPAKKPAK